LAVVKLARHIQMISMVSINSEIRRRNTIERQIEKVRLSENHIYTTANSLPCVTNGKVHTANPLFYVTNGKVHTAKPLLCVRAGPRQKKVAPTTQFATWYVCRVPRGHAHSKQWTICRVSRWQAHGKCWSFCRVHGISTWQIDFF